MFFERTLHCYVHNILAIRTNLAQFLKQLSSTLIITGLDTNKLIFLLPSLGFKMQLDKQSQGNPI